MTPDTLRRWRARLGLTQAGAAEALGVPKRTYEGWEAKKAPPYPLMLSLACAALAKKIRPVK